jgi:UDP-N-acetylglucosamine 3-dehydrogenase
MTHRIGIIGCGWAGAQHARALAELGRRLTLHAVADVNDEHARALAGPYGATHVFTDYHALLEVAELAAVSICLPHDLHAPVALDALAAGKHVLIEKPLATALDDADAIIAAADRTGLVAMVAENVRFDAAYRRAAEIIRSGMLGDLFLIRVAREHNMRDYLRARPWFLTDPTGGITFSGGVHDFELVRMLGGEIDHVYGLTAPRAVPGMQGDDTSVVVAQLRSGPVATLVESFSLRTPSPGVHGTVHGSSGSLWFHGDRLRVYRAETDGQSEAVSEITVTPEDTFVAEIGHFIDCIDERREPITSAREQRNPLVAVLAAYASFERGTRVELSAFDDATSERI